MTAEFEVKRYAAYYKGWCQAFGDHEGVLSEESELSWLFSENQVGFISPQELTKSLLREILRKRKTPKLIIGQHSIQVGHFHHELPKATDESALQAIANLLEMGHGAHIFLTSHFIYGTGTRILTISGKKPLAIIYKEIGTMKIALNDTQHIKEPLTDNP